jgi:hypothetical protein
MFPVAVISQANFDGLLGIPHTEQVFCSFARPISGLRFEVVRLEAVSIAQHQGRIQA